MSLLKQHSINGTSKKNVEGLITTFNLGDAQQTILEANRVLQAHPEEEVAWSIMGASLSSLGKLHGAAKCFKQVVQLNPNNPGGFNNLGEVLRVIGQLDESIQAFKKAISLKPDFAIAYQNMGLTYQQMGDLGKSISWFEKATELDPNSFQSFFNLGSVYCADGQAESAIKALQKALALKPNCLDTVRKLVGIYVRQNERLKAAEVYESYVIEEPMDANVYNSLGVLYADCGETWKAIEAYYKAVTVDPNHFNAHNNMGNAFKNLDKLSEALECFAKAFNANPDYIQAKMQKLHLELQFCNWENYDQEVKDIPKMGVEAEPVPPWPMLALEDCIHRQKIRAERYVKHGLFVHDLLSERLPVCLPPVSRPKKLKIGYFSADFHIFPGMFLMAGLLEEHNRKNFEVMAFSYGPDKNDTMRKRIVNAVDEFIDLNGKSIDQIIEISREKEIDIAIHRNGHTRGTKTEIFMKRVAPLQINYLGYPGTIGGDFIDYIIGDHTVIPEEHNEFYSEKIIRLPHTYQPNDITRLISKKDTSRNDFDLPQEAFVFCCFNNTFKITPNEFNIWMSVLSKVDGAVLWLLKTDERAEMNIKSEAKKRGVDPNRLVFANKLPQAEHLARHKHADLFLDTFCYNAHTTASDALWAGLPVITKKGEQFAARVSASLLTAVGLPELITETDADYENLIIELANQPEKLCKIRSKLQSNRLTKPLFDTKRYTRNFEAGLLQAYDLYFKGEQPRHIYVKDAN